MIVYLLLLSDFMKINVTFGLTCTEEEAYKKKIKEALDRELESAVGGLVEKSLSNFSIDEQHIKNLVDITVKETIGNRLEPFLKELFQKLEDETKLFNKYFLQQNEKVLRLFSNGSALENVSCEFLYVVIDGNLHAEYMARKHYEDRGFKVLKTCDYKLLSPEDIVRQTLEPILSKEGLRGAPDFIIRDNRNGTSFFFFVEVKSTKDSIRADQMFWYKTHPSLLIKVLFINPIASSTAEGLYGGRDFIDHASL